MSALEKIILTPFEDKTELEKFIYIAAIGWEPPKRVTEAAAKELAELCARIAELEANGHEAKAYLTSLIIHFNAEPLDTLLGLCTQIDNIMTLIPKWQPIETAPINTVVMLCNSYKDIFEDHIGFGWQREINGNMRWQGYYSDPTHWMPLPEPPEEV